MGVTLEGAKPYELPGVGRNAALFVHGFTGSPQELRPLADFVWQNLGWHCEAILLKGHGTSTKDLDEVRLEDWEAQVDKAFHLLVNKFDSVHLIGLSMGALLSILLAAKSRPSSLTLLAPPLVLRPTFFMGLHILTLPMISRLFHPIQKPSRMPGHVAYDAYPLRGMREFKRCRANARRVIDKLRSPTFFVTGLKDRVVHPKSADFFQNRSVLEKDFEYLELKNSGHILPLDVEAERLQEAVLKFFKKRL